MRIEVDQSGKIEMSGVDTVLSFSNQEQFTILIGRKTKREIFTEVKKKHFKIKIFAVCLYLLLKDKLHNKELVVIDKEYVGHEDTIKSILLELVRRNVPKFDRKFIKFSQVTKISNAHHIALATYRGELKPNKIISKNEILDLLK